jgi:enoyl-CoA hydratase/carnithine racemase
MAFLKMARDGAVLTLTMSQPETRNALTGNTAVDEFVQACEEIRRDRGVRVVILTGEGPVFSSGGNVKDMQRFFQQPPAADAIREEYRNGIQRLPRALYHLDVPVIAAVNGPAVGAGLDLACMCDIRIASETATFAESFVRVGIVPGDGGAWLLPRAGAAPRRPRWRSPARRSARRKRWPPAWCHAWSRPRRCWRPRWRSPARSLRIPAACCA